ncbi:MAG: efflux RND transporter permease subunit [Deltaproteobacteria bacterium]|nr:efflux RND transporter permease subunit [Deltaproteobacteria bacterium]
MIVLIVFLRELRVTTLIATAIPFSPLMTVTVLSFIGDSLNLLSLMGLMIALHGHGGRQPIGGRDDPPRERVWP